MFILPFGGYITERPRILGALNIRRVPPGRQPTVLFYLKRTFPLASVYLRWYTLMCRQRIPGVSAHLPYTTPYIALCPNKSLVKEYGVSCPSSHREASEEVRTTLEGSAATVHTSRAVGARGSFMGALMTRLCHFIQRL